MRPPRKERMIGDSYMISPKLLARVRAAAKRAGISKSALIREALMDKVARCESLYNLAERVIKKHGVWSGGQK